MGMAPSIHIGLLVEQRYLAQTQPNGLASALRARGHRVTFIDPQANIFEVGHNTWLHDFDLLVGRGRSCGLLCLLAWAETCGVPTINRRPAIGAVHNKAEMAVVMAAANL